MVRGDGGNVRGQTCLQTNPEEWERSQNLEDPLNKLGGQNHLPVFSQVHKVKGGPRKSEHKSTKATGSVKELFLKPP
jgi:hypothetical protein